MSARPVLEAFTEYLRNHQFLSPAAMRAVYDNGNSAEEIGKAIGRALGHLLTSGDVCHAAKACGIEPIGDVLRGFMAERRPEHTELAVPISPPTVDEGDRFVDVLATFDAQFKKTGTLWSGGQVDRSVVDAYAHAVQSTPEGGPPILDTFRTRATKAGVDSQEIDAFIDAVQRRVQGRSIRLVSFAEIMAEPDPRFLIDGLIEEGSMAVLFSEPKLGKTFIVLDWCFCVATGLPWLGRPVIQGAVIYVGAEGGGGLAKRYRALVDHHEIEAPPPDFHTIKQAINLLDQMSVAEAISAVKDCKVTPALVVFDTYARSTVGGDENSAKDAGLAIAAIDHLRFTLKTAVLVVHHETKSGKTERGSGALRGAADTMLNLAKGTSGTLILAVEDQRNFDGGPPIILRLEPVGDSLVPAEVVDTRSKWEKVFSEAEEPADGKRASMVAAIEAALKKAHEEHQTPITQTKLLAPIKGSAKWKGEILHELADDPDSPVTMAVDGKRKLYSWH